MKNPIELISDMKSTVVTTSINSTEVNRKETVSQSTSLLSLQSIGEFEKAGQLSGEEYEGPINISNIDDYSLSSELEQLKSIVESSKKRNRKSLSEELKDLWEGLQGKKSEIELDSNVFQTSSDSESVYETEDSPVETVFRSNSYDEFVEINKEPKAYDGHLILVDEKDKRVQLHKEKEKKDKKIESDLLVDKFSESFNLKNDDVTNSKKRETSGNNLNPSLSKSSITSFDQEASIDLSFSDILTKDIIQEDQQPKANNNEKTKQLEVKLNVSDSEIIQLIVEQLKRDLEPTLAQLTKESEKYQILKKLYKLPSISNLNGQMQMRYKRGCKKFNLEFDESIIQELIDKKRNELDNQLKIHVLPPQDQIKLNFNKFRRLNTISEDTEVSQRNIKIPIKTPKNDNQRVEVMEDKSDEQSDRIADKVIEYECEKKTYQRVADKRHIKDLSLGELKTIEVMIINNQLKDTSKVKQICGLFERDFSNIENRPINKLTNSVLSSEICKEIIKRRLQ